MTTVVDKDLTSEKTVRGLRQRISDINAIWRQPVVVAAIVTAAAWIVIAAFAPLLAPFDPIAQSSEIFAKPSATHIFGTDELGATYCPVSSTAPDSPFRSL